jgi:hypothetical protein
MTTRPPRALPGDCPGTPNCSSTFNLLSPKLRQIASALRRESIRLQMVIALMSSLSSDGDSGPYGTG